MSSMAFLTFLTVPFDALICREVLIDIYSITISKLKNSGGLVLFQTTAVFISVRRIQNSIIFYSERNATTGSFLAALLDGIRPEKRVSATLINTRMTAT